MLSLRDMEHRYTKVKYTRSEESIDFIYRMLGSLRNALVIHQPLAYIPPLDAMRRCRGRIRIVVTEESPFLDILVESAEWYVVLDYSFNPFQDEFLARFCEANGRSIVHFTEKDAGHRLAREGRGLALLGGERKPMA
jgi:hypothetical protein